jgi:hypothetical protein
MIKADNKLVVTSIVFYIIIIIIIMMVVTIMPCVSLVATCDLRNYAT